MHKTKFSRLRVISNDSKGVNSQGHYILSCTNSDPHLFTPQHVVSSDRVYDHRIRGAISLFVYTMWSLGFHTVVYGKTYCSLQKGSSERRAWSRVLFRQNDVYNCFTIWYKLFILSIWDSQKTFQDLYFKYIFYNDFAAWGAKIEYNCLQT